MDSQQSSHPAGSLTQYSLDRNAALSAYSTRDILVELINRTGRDQQASNQEIAFLGQYLERRLSSFSDVHLNRHSFTNLRNVFSALANPNIDCNLPIKGAIWVELGCGSLNPFSLSFLLLALGAQRAIPIDLEAVIDSGEACKTLAEIAKCLFVDPDIIVGKNIKIDTEEIFSNIRDFDLTELNKGSLSGIPSSRLSYRNESVYSMSLEKGAVDVVVSNAFMEHVPDVDGAIKAMAEITKIGGYGVHVIDTIDHRSYGISDVAPLDFLKIESSDALVYGSNRLRPKEYNPIFEKNGFKILGAAYGNFVPLSEDERSLFLPPWNLMPLDDLKATVVYISVQRIS